MTPASKVLTTASSIFLPSFPSSASSTTISPWRHSELLETTSLFLLQRYLGYAQIKELFAEDATAYESKTPWNFIVDNQYPFPIESLQATHSPMSCYTDVKYCTDLLLANERMFFDPNTLKIQSIQTTYSHGNSSSFTPRITTCGGTENPDMITALSSARLLHLACRFLKADVMQDLSMQTKLLAEDVIAFGIKGREGIIEAQREGIEGGTTYTVPFPLQVNIEANCVSLDFYAHKSNNSDGTKQRQRGTDIMYCDVREDKIARIDTLRHTLMQPNWVKQHFAL